MLCPFGRLQFHYILSRDKDQGIQLVHQCIFLIHFFLAVEFRTNYYRSYLYVKVYIGFDNNNGVDMLEYYKYYLQTNTIQYHDKLLFLYSMKESIGSQTNDVS